MQNERIGDEEFAKLSAEQKGRLTAHQELQAKLEASKTEIRDNLSPLLEESMRRFFEAVPEVSKVVYSDYLGYGMLDITLALEDGDALYTWGTTYEDIDHVSGPNASDELEERLNAAFDVLYEGGWCSMWEALSEDGEIEDEDDARFTLDYNRDNLDVDLDYLPY